MLTREREKKEASKLNRTKQKEENKLKWKAVDSFMQVEIEIKRVHSTDKLWGPGDNLKNS